MSQAFARMDGRHGDHVAGYAVRTKRENSYAQPQISWTSTDVVD